MTIVLDSSAVLAVLFNETGSDYVKAAYQDEDFENTLISAVNVAEVVGKLAHKGMTNDAIAQTLAAFPHRCVAFSSEEGMIAGVLFRHTKPHDLSIGDRACLALGMRMKARVLTADRIWGELDADRIRGATVESIR